MITPSQHVKLKEECRKKGVEVYSIFTYNTENRHEGSTVKDIIFKSKLPTLMVLEVAIYYFNGLGYQGKVKVEHVKDDVYKAVLSRRLKY